MDKTPRFKCFVDLEGKIPAKPGDRVALAVQKEPNVFILIQKDISLRPTMAEDGSIHFEGGDNEESEWMEVKNV